MIMLMIMIMIMIMVMILFYSTLSYLIHTNHIRRTSERLLIAADHAICGTSAGTWSVGVGSWVVSAAYPTVGARTWSVGVGTWSVCRIFDNEGQVNIRASSHRGGSWRTSERLLIAADHTICGSSAGTWSVGVGSWLVCATSSISGSQDVGSGGRDLVCVSHLRQ
jgi:hypothetical protein